MSLQVMYSISLSTIYECYISYDQSKLTKPHGFYTIQYIQSEPRIMYRLANRYQQSYFAFDVSVFPENTDKTKFYLKMKLDRL